MGRPRGDPSDQAARGYPGQRKSKTEKAIAEAERQAKLLALPRAEETSDSPPAHLTDPRLAPAMAVWKEYAPRLDKLHLLARLERHTFALFCVYAGEFVVANEDVLVKGYSTRVKTASGDYMLRENPSVSRRDFAAKRSLGQVRPDAVRSQQTAARRRAAVRFRNAVRRRVAAGEIPTPGAIAPALVSHDSAAIGSLSGFDSAPPGAKPN